MTDGPGSLLMGRRAPSPGGGRERNADVSYGTAMLPTSLRVVVVVAMLSVVAAPGGRGAAEPGHDAGLEPHWLSDIVSRSDQAGAEAFEMRVVVAADEEFVRARGPGWASEARAVVMGAADLMGQVDLALTVTRVTRWESPPGRLPDLVGDAVSQVGLPPDALLVALTSQGSNGSPTYDGWASASRPVIVIKVTDPYRPTLPSLVAHEIGHMLGLDEHGSDHRGDDDGCLMVGTGYRNGERWCPEDEEAVARALASLP